MRQSDLHVQWHRHHVADQQVKQTIEHRWNRGEKNEKPKPEENDRTDLSRTERRTRVFREIDVRLDLQIKTSETHDQIVRPVLKRNETRGEPVVRENTLMVRRVNRLQKSRRNGEEW